MKEDILEEEIVRFKNSEQKTEDFMELFVVFYRVVKPDSGLSWSEIKDILNKVINDVR